MLQPIGQTNLQGSRVALGCMRMASLDIEQAMTVLTACQELGINFFDHADIYGGGESERRFAQAQKALGIKREEMILQSKCGIRRGFFDFSKDHIFSSVDGILERLETDYLDILALHRPDTLMEPEEVAEAFYQLKKAGKVKHFGVSNQNPQQMALLQAYLDEPLAVNQLQLSPAHTPMIDSGLNVNMLNQAGVNRDNGVLEYCRLNKVTIQAWSPFQVDLAKGVFFNHPDYQDLVATLDQYAQQFGVSREAMVVAWILRHPAQMQVLIGSMNPDRIANMMQSKYVDLSREDWYAIYRSAGNVLP
ncbi:MULTISPECIES: aldo/keto reductase family oxidoreductase [unclassified Streptococcus]|uniref:aldo/keto reductase n=1 Tax=unclassified Streptococcus TaxID=2608887 RepID=UPI00359E284A